ncbi:hypothetical protein [Thermomonas sp.]|uniref:hypothetical protein n=1 Tax=Thermomonas sp. TaxID=1971895 RepID=UPI001AD54E22|nr:hypothetical protein [Xanthomonadales bacterium]MBN8769202.1 hypothetical protein [Stenotrophomonas sp.]
MSTPHETDDTALRLALRGLRREIAPGRDLWPGIAARLPAQAAATPPPTRLPPHRRGWPWPLALAASLALALGLAWQLRPGTSPAPMPTDSPQRLAAQAASPAASPRVAPAGAYAALPPEAAQLTRHYEAALAEIRLPQVPASWQPGMQALDRSAEQIRQALREQPDSRLLLERLRQTYARRIALTRRALYA